MPFPTDVTTEEEYLIREPEAEYKSEFREGKIVAMSGASPAHVRIAGNFFYSLRRQLAGKPCEVFINDMRVKVAAAQFYTYPDMTVVCGSPRFDLKDPHSLTNPALIVEVLSDSTAAYDRIEKFEYYKKLASLRDYILVRQNEPQVEVQSRIEDQWSSRVFQSLDATFELNVRDTLGAAQASVVVTLAELYERVFTS
jgi:Uma2 family endonuclease